MNDVFVSYKREDGDRVIRLVQALKIEGLSVWWDRDIAGGDRWLALTQQALDTAKCAVVVWTHGSVGPAGDFVCEEARRARRRGILVAVRMDDVEPPLGFGGLQAWDMIGWTGSRRDPRFADLRAAVRARIADQPAPKPKAPTRLLARRVAYGSLGSGAMIGALVIGTNQFGAQDRLCRVPLWQPQLADICGSVGLGNQPKRDERLAWTSRAPGSCDALKTHVERFPKGIHTRDATDLLAAKRVSTKEVWASTIRNLTIYQPQDERAHASTEAAQTASLALGQTKARQLCNSFAATTRFRLASAGLDVATWDCAQHSKGISCGFDGEAICALEERSDVTTEYCGP